MQRGCRTPPQCLGGILPERGPIVRRESAHLAKPATQRHLPHAPGPGVLQSGACFGQCQFVQMPRRRRAAHGAYCTSERALVDGERRADVRHAARPAERCARKLLEGVDDLPVALCRHHGASPQFHRTGICRPRWRRTIAPRGNSGLREDARVAELGWELFAPCSTWRAGEGLGGPSSRDCTTRWRCSIRRR